MARILFLRLEGPLQSWGEHAKWDRRDSALMPTKSGIVGILACALGLKRGDPGIGELSRSLRMAVRADRPGQVMTDFHTVHADAARGERIFNAEGKPRGDTIVTRRMYLQDASFLVAVEAREEVLARLESALRRPHWVISLGRKSCVPSYPIVPELSDDYASLDDAMRRHPEPKRVGDKSSAALVYELDSDDEPGDGNGNIYLRSDERVDGWREFAMRRVVLRSIGEGDSRVPEQN